MSDLAVYPGGDVVVAGEFSTATDFGRGLRTPRSRDGFVARYASDGAPVRDAVHLMPSGSGDLIAVSSIAIGPGVSTVLCGLFSGSVDFGGSTRTSYGSVDGFLLRLGS